MKALCGTATVSCVAMRVKMRSVRPTTASAAGTYDLQADLSPEMSTATLRDVRHAPQLLLRSA